MTPTARRFLTAATVLGLATAASGALLQAQLPQAVNTWIAGGAIAENRTGAVSVALADGRTVIAGGQRADGSATDSIVLYDAAANTSVAAGQLIAPRVHAAAAALADGRIVVAGGLVDGTPNADIEIFDPATGSSVFAGTMTVARAWHAAAVLADGRTLIVGGTDESGAVLASAELFDPETNVSVATGGLATPRTGASATTLIEGRVLVAGGFNGAEYLATAEIFDVYGGELFLPAASALSVARGGHTALLLPHNAGVLIAGGTANGAAATAVDLFLPAVFPDPYSWGMGAFAPAGPLNLPRTFGVTGPLGDNGFAYVAGGGADILEAYRFATVRTDKDDYAPGERAVISGSGWQPGETVTLLFQEDPSVHDDYSLPVTADANGNIFWDQWAPEAHDLSVRFYLMALGSQSRAQTTFTDGNVNVRATGTSGTAATILWARYPNATCSGVPTVSGSISATTTGNGTGVPGGAAEGQSLLLTAQAPGGHSFADWTGDISTPAPDAANPICVAGRTPTRQIQANFNGDSQAPSVASIELVGDSLTNAGSVSWTVTFSESVSGVNAGDFALVVTGVTGSPAITGVSGSGAAYLVTASTGNGTGAIGLNLNDNDSIRDAAANRLGGTGTGVAGGGGAGNGSVAGPAFALDRTLVPTITAADKTYDGTTSATIVTRAFTSALPVSDSVEVTGGTASFENADAGLDKTVTATGLGLSGPQATRYVLGSTTATTTADITPADALIDVDGYSGTYDAQHHGATLVSATGLSGADLSAFVILGGETFIDVPGGTATWSFANPNYVPQSGGVDIAIARAAAQVTVNGYTGVYDALAHGANGTAAGVADADLAGSLTFGDSFTDVPGGTANWTFHGGTNYIDQSGQVEIVITPATASVTVSGYSGVYDGLAHGAVVSEATGVGGEDLAALVTLGGETFTNVPGGTATWSFAHQNYTSRSGTAAVSISPATATIAVADYSVQYDGEPHGPHGVATGVDGVDLRSFFSYGGSVIDVPGGTIAWSFDAGANYHTATGSTTVTITPAPANVTVAGHTGAYDGAAHGATLVSATGVGGSDLSGFVRIGSQTFTDVPGGSVPWSFAHPNYVGQSGAAAIVITPAAATIEVAGYEVQYDGEAHGLGGTATGVGGAILTSYLTFGAPVTDVPGGAITWSFDAGPNYETASGSATVTVTARPLTVSATGIAKIYDGTTTASVTLGDNRIVGDVFSVSYASASFDTRHVGASKPIAVSGIALSGADAGNYAANSTATASAEISRAALTIAAVTDARVYDGTVASAGVPTVGTLFGTDTVTGLAQTFDTRHVGTGKTLSVSAYTVNDGNDGHNYMVAPVANQTGVITLLALVVNGVTANNKPFDGNTSATLNFGAAALAGVIAPDVVSLNTAGATGTFASSAVGTWTVTVAGLTLGGTNSGNYLLTQPTTTATITAWALSGFFQPIGIPNTYPGVPASLGVWNTIKGGQTVPLKFRLFATAGGTELTSITDVSGFSLTILSCSTGYEDPVEPEFVTPGATVLRYSDGHFIQNWDSPKGASKCYRLTMTARDGSQLSTFFKTK